MGRIGRLVVPGIPHHVTQRGNRRETTFFADADYRLYLDLLRAAGPVPVAPGELTVRASLRVTWALE